MSLSASKNKVYIILVLFMVFCCANVNASTKKHLDCSFLNNTTWTGQITDQTTGKTSTILIHLIIHYIPKINEVAGYIKIGSVTRPFDYNSQSDCVSGYGVPYMVRINLPYPSSDSNFYFGYSIDSPTSTTLTPHWIYGAADDYTSSTLSKN